VTPPFVEASIVLSADSPIRMTIQTQKRPTGFLFGLFCVLEFVARKQNESAASLSHTGGAKYTEQAQ